MNVRNSVVQKIRTRDSHKYVRIFAGRISEMMHEEEEWVLLDDEESLETAPVVLGGPSDGKV